MQILMGLGQSSVPILDMGFEKTWAPQKLSISGGFGSEKSLDLKELRIMERHRNFSFSGGFGSVISRSSIGSFVRVRVS